MIKMYEIETKLLISSFFRLRAAKSPALGRRFPAFLVDLLDFLQNPLFYRFLPHIVALLAYLASLQTVSKL